MREATFAQGPGLSDAPAKRDPRDPGFIPTGPFPRFYRIRLARTPPLVGSGAFQVEMTASSRVGGEDPASDPPDMHASAVRAVSAAFTASNPTCLGPNASRQGRQLKILAVAAPHPLMSRLDWIRSVLCGQSGH